MNRTRLIQTICLPFAAAAITLGCTGVASAATPAHPAVISQVSAPTYSTGATNIDMTITNNSGAPITLVWSGLAGSFDHWDKRPQQTLGAGDSEELTGYSHLITDDLTMGVIYQTSSGDLATFDATAKRTGGPNNLDGTVVNAAQGGTATDLQITGSINDPNTLYDYAVANLTLGPVA